jgi:preprotein translocase subunit SecB
VVANITREGGFMPLNLNPIDFLALYQQNMQQRQKAQAAATPS